VPQTVDQGSERILIFALFGADAAITARVLSSQGIASEVCASVEALSDGIRRGRGALVLTEEALVEDTAQQILRALATQPPWSDLPVIVSAIEPEAARERGGLLSHLGTHANLTVLDRPVRVGSMITAIRSALRARRRQYQTRDLLEELAHARSLAEEASRTKDEFVATISHELRTPLNAMLGWSRMLLSGALDSARQQRAIEAIERNAVSQAQLIDDLLDTSRILGGTFRLDAQTLNLVTVLEAAIEAVRPAMEGKRVTFEADLRPDAGPVLGDPQRLQQIFWNLLANAAKFTPAGGSIRLALAKGPEGVEVSVSDTGQGISPDFLPHVFERFRQADPKITRKHGGLGLGLSIARHLVELHGGTIRASSAGEGKGATFRVTLPPMHAAVQLAGTSNGSSHPNGFASLVFPAELRGLRVLVVDDDRDTLALSAAILEACGTLATTAHSADEAMRAMTATAHDVLVSDLGMPDEDGYELIRRVRALPDGRGAIPAMALTAYARAEDRRKALVAGYQMHLAKPVEPRELVSAVAELVRIGRG
jgi:signal transduction histidine kinase/CheY-like chemotaxis protein